MSDFEGDQEIILDSVGGEGGLDASDVYWGLTMMGVGEAIRGIPGDDGSALGKLRMQLQESVRIIENFRKAELKKGDVTFMPEVKALANVVSFVGYYFDRSHNSEGIFMPAGFAQSLTNEVTGILGEAGARSETEYMENGKPMSGSRIALYRSYISTDPRKKTLAEPLIASVRETFEAMQQSGEIKGKMSWEEKVEERKLYYLRALESDQKFGDSV